MVTNYVMGFTDVDMDTAIFENEFYRAIINKKVLPQVEVEIVTLPTSQNLRKLFVEVLSLEGGQLRVLAEEKDTHYAGVLDVTQLEREYESLRTTAISARNLEHALRNYYRILKQLGGDRL